MTRGVSFGTKDSPRAGQSTRSVSSGEPFCMRTNRIEQLSRVCAGRGPCSRFLATSLPLWSRVMQRKQRRFASIWAPLIPETPCDCSCDPSGPKGRRLKSRLPARRGVSRVQLVRRRRYAFRACFVRAYSARISAEMRATLVCRDLGRSTRASAPKPSTQRSSSGQRRTRILSKQPNLVLTNF